MKTAVWFFNQPVKTSTRFFWAIGARQNAIYGIGAVTIGAVVTYCDDFNLTAGGTNCGSNYFFAFSPVPVLCCNILE